MILYELQVLLPNGVEPLMGTRSYDGVPIHEGSNARIGVPIL